MAGGFDQFLSMAPGLISSISQMATGMGSIWGARRANYQGQAQGQFFDDQATLVRLDEMRSHDNLKIESQRTLSAAKAISAAQGGDIDEGIVSSIAAQYGDQDMRITNDSSNKQRMLRMRANYARMAGADAETAGTMKGLGQVAAGGYSLYDTLKSGFPAEKPAKYANVGELIDAKNIS